MIYHGLGVMRLLDQSWTCGLSECPVLGGRYNSSTKPATRAALVPNPDTHCQLSFTPGQETFGKSVAEAERNELVTPPIDSTITVKSELHEDIN